jgi:hypothetical protein
MVSIQLKHWNPKNKGLDKAIQYNLNYEVVGDLKNAFLNAWDDYDLYHRDRNQWKIIGFDEELKDEEWRQTKGITRAMANVQSAWDNRRSHLRVLSKHRAHLPEAKSTLQTTCSDVQRAQGVGITAPHKSMEATRALRRSVEDATLTLGMVRKKEEEWEEGWWGPPTLNKHTPHRRVDCGQVAESSTKEEGGSVTDHSQETVRNTQTEEMTGWEVMSESWWSEAEGCYPDTNNSDGTC